MAPKMIVMDNPLSAMDIARELAPAGIDMIVARADSPEFRAALADVEYIVGLGEVKMDDAFYKSAPKLKLIQLRRRGVLACRCATTAGPMRSRSPSTRSC
jgi:phosphoglycerate dehydrogenase-like enzyme